MRASEMNILRELNNLSEEVFKLYSLGMYQEAMIKATGVLRTAKEKLGQWHPSLRTYNESLEFVKTAKQRFESYRSVNTGNGNKKLSNYILISELNDNIINHFRAQKYNDALRETRKALSLAIKTFGRNHPYINILNANIRSIQTKLQVKPTIIEEPLLKINKKRFLTKRKFITFLMVFLLILIFMLSSLIIDHITFPTFEIKKSFTSFFTLPATKNPASYQLKDKVLLDVPLVLQYPELPRGCEIASLTMLLNQAGVDVNKLTLAKKVKKENTPYQVVDGRTYYGNPDYGFVGDIYSLKKPGLGVYHEPINALMKQYLPDNTIDLTGRNFDDILHFISNGIPVWVITNTQFKELSPNDFNIWYTSYGPVQITYKQHSVLITGYDKNYIYFNDPLVNKKNQKAPREAFEKAWIQMGRQAITYLPSDKKLIEILPIE